MNYEIRIMQPEDANRVLEIFQQGINGRNATFDKEIPNWEKWDKEHFPVSRFVMENENEKVIGWCALAPVSNRECFKGVAEISIYLDNEFHNRGLGKILLKKLILDSEENGFWTLQAGIFPENTASISIHQSLGFRKIGIREKIAEMNGVWRDIVLLERRSGSII